MLKSRKVLVMKPVLRKFLNSGRRGLTMRHLETAEKVFNNPFPTVLRQVVGR
jgi:hypothetical protein